MGIARFRVAVLVVVLAAVAGAGAWGAGVFSELTEGGYNDPGSESARAAETVERAFGAQGGDVVLIYTPANGKIDDPVLAQRVENSLNHLPRDVVTATDTYWTARAEQYASADKRS